MLFNDIGINLPEKYPSEFETDEAKKIFYTTRNWECDCFNDVFLEFLSERQLIERYYQILKNYYIFVRPENDKVPIDNFYSSWFWTRELYKIKVIFKARKLSLPDDVIKEKILPTYRTIFKNKVQKLFRFSELKYNLDFLVHGNIRFSSAFNYQSDDNDARNDNELEKKFIYSGQGSSIITSDGKKIPCIGTSSTNFSAYPYYLFCMSLQYNSYFYKEMKNYDSCVVIHNVPEFYCRIRNAFIKQFSANTGDIRGVPVNYYNKFSKMNGLKKKLNPYCDKDLMYAWQEEYRFVAFPNKYNASYFILNIGSLKDIAEIVTIKPKDNS